MREFLAYLLILMAAIPITVFLSVRVGRWAYLESTEGWFHHNWKRHQQQCKREKENSTQGDSDGKST